MNFEEARAKLEKAGQLHVLRYYDELTEDRKASLLAQIEATDFDVIRYVAHRDELPGRGVITPLKAMQVEEVAAHEAEYEAAGLEAIRQGKMAAVVLAGGMGTRLGSDKPKCMFNIGKTHPVYIIERQIINLLEVVEKAGVYPPLLIMTSDKNDEVTRAFLKEHDYFGYDAEKVFFFKQEMAPATDYTGKVYMEDKDRIASSPNGNGGWFLSMARSGVLAKMKELGVEWLNAYSVDNVLQRICDPVFLGSLLVTGRACGAKVIRKVDPDEKVGAICLEDGRPSIVEYYDMTPELKAAVLEDGEPAYNYGVILNYLFRIADLERVMDEALPLHIVEKKIPYMNEAGEFISPKEPNGYKFESLILDMIHEMDSCLPIEVVREKEFAPIKNPTGVDSVESAQALLEALGVTL